MTTDWTLAAAFAAFGAQGRNPRWSWSARSADGATVVMTLWRDEFDHTTIPVSYSSFGRQPALWMRRPGNRERLANLLWAREHCGGRFRVVVTVAADPRADPRRIARCFPHPSLVMRLVALDTATGAFRAEAVPAA